MKIEKFSNPRGEWCCFNPATRAYWNGMEEDKESSVLGEMMSTTKLIGQFYTVSPWQGETVDADFDKRVHAVAADCLHQQHTSVSARTDEERKAFSALWQFARRIRDNNQMVEIEKPVFSSFVGVAGAIDVTFQCNNRIFVCGWKTGNLMLSAKCKFNSPFGHLVADPITIYALQCSMFQVLLDVGGYFTNADFAPARLLWLHKGEDGGYKVDALTCRDMRREASEMLLIRGYTPWYADWQKRCPF